MTKPELAIGTEAGAAPGPPLTGIIVLGIRPTPICHSGSEGTETGALVLAELVGRIVLGIGGGAGIVVL